MQFTDEQQRFIDEHYQLLPKDADGEYIHIGDVMELTRLSNKPSFEVRAMRYDEGGWEVYDRLGLEDQYMDILGVKVPMNTIPITPGRNLAVILEVAAMNNRQRKMGYNPAKEFTEQMDSHFKQSNF